MLLICGAGVLIIQPKAKRAYLFFPPGFTDMLFFIFVGP